MRVHASADRDVDIHVDLPRIVGVVGLVEPTHALAGFSDVIFGGEVAAGSAASEAVIDVAVVESGSRPVSETRVSSITTTTLAASTATTAAVARLSDKCLSYQVTVLRVEDGGRGLTRCSCQLERLRRTWSRLKTC